VYDPLVKRDDEDRGEWPASWLRGVRQFLTQDVWSVELRGLPTFRAFFYKTSRVVFLAVRGVIEDRCLIRASALTYITVLSIVPLLAFVFSVAKGLGAYESLKLNTIDPFLAGVIGPSPEAATAAADLRVAIDQMFEFVAQTDVGKLGTFGLAILVYVVLKLLGSIERSFNDIWGVRKSRNLGRKFADYLSMVIIVPIFLVSATTLTAALQALGETDDPGFLREWLQRLGPLIAFALKFGSLVAMWLGFAFAYKFMPNTKTRISSALIGGIVGGSLWHLAQILHVKLQLGMASYNALYAGFAAFPVFLVWIYASWVTVLVGAEFASAHQNEPAYRQIARSRHHDHAFKELLALRAMARVAAAFLEGRVPYSVQALADSLGVPARSVDEVLARLRDHEIVAIADEDTDPTVLPARDLERITMKQIVDALKGTRGRVEIPATDPVDALVDALFATFEEDREHSHSNRTLRDLAEACLREERDAEPVAEGAPSAAPG